MSALVEQIGRECEGADCAARVALKYGRYCDQCRSSRRRKKKKYVSNDFIDQRLRALYRESPDRKRNSGQSVKKLAAQIRWPVWALRVRARQLGIARTKDRPWCERELNILQRFAWMCPSRIQMKLKAAGFHRTQTAIDIKLDRTYARRNTPFFTATSLAGLFGVDGHVVTRWIKLGYLAASRRGTDRHEGNGGDMFQIHEKEVYKFVLARPTEIDIRKVDQMWFLDLVTEGKIAGA